MDKYRISKAICIEEWVGLYRKKNKAADRWAIGYGPIEHSVETQARVLAMAEILAARGTVGDGIPLFELLYAADRLACAAMWLVAHETYAQNVYLDGRGLASEDFKPKPEGHTGGALNMVPAYTGYMAANAITGDTRSWIMGQGHCVAAIDTVNLLLGNMTQTHAERYSITNEGLSRYVRDFYSYKLGENGEQDSPLGSHVNVNTAGGIAEGGYLGFTELQYVHMPLPGERLVAFLSDGAFEEQRGSDWVPRWWRAEDCGLVIPIMINNGRRIDQRTTMSQQGGTDWFTKHLEINSFAPIIFDGRDPSAFGWAIFEMECRLEALAKAVRMGREAYPISMPYGIAVAPKGAGFYGEGTNLAHNLPLTANPYTDVAAARQFNESARKLWVPLTELKKAISMFQQHEVSGRPKEIDHPIAHRNIKLNKIPPLVSRPVPKDRMDYASWTRFSPMYAVDTMFLAIVKANPHLRPRVGNPDEMRSNRMLRTLDALKFRVTDPESKEVPEDIHGAVITALNEEAVAAAALANKGGINIIVTYEAFGAKMHGVVRQEVIFANHCEEKGRPQKWISVPLVLTSHTWENAKNEQSHQDPTMAEAMLSELSDVSRVLFVPDYNTAAVVTQAVYQTQGQIWTLVVPKIDSAPDLFTPAEAAKLLEQGALRLNWAGYQKEPQLVLTAIGSYQLEESLKASTRLAEREIPHSVVYMLEPGRFRKPRSHGEESHIARGELTAELYPDTVPVRIFVTHTRPEPLLGVLQPLHTGNGKTNALGFIGQGGTLTVLGMLFVNRCTWAHILAEAARLLELNVESLLSSQELAALEGRTFPEGVII